jgi:hypothetical protein
MALGIVCIVAAAQKINLNLVFAARGMGPETFTRKVCAINPGATWETAPTHWLMSLAGGDAAELTVLQAMTQGDLPDLPMGVVWGEDDVISAADAMACSDGAVFHVYSAAGDIEPVDHVTAVLASEGLQYVPEPPL